MRKFRNNLAIRITNTRTMLQVDSQWNWFKTTSAAQFLKKLNNLTCLWINIFSKKLKKHNSKSVYDMMYTCAIKGNQLQDTKYGEILPSATSKPSSATAKTKHCHSLFPIVNFSVYRKCKHYFHLQVYNYKTCTPESRIRTKHIEGEREEKRKRKKKRGRKR